MQSTPLGISCRQKRIRNSDGFVSGWRGEPGELAIMKTAYGTRKDNESYKLKQLVYQFAVLGG